MKLIFTTTWSIFLSNYSIREAHDVPQDQRPFLEIIKQHYRHAQENFHILYILLVSLYFYL